jgi:hypothetical protein
VLLRLRISTASFGVFHARHWLLNGKHEVNFQTGEPDYGIDNATLRRQWQHFRNEVDEWRMILLWLPTFVEQNFNTADENLQKAYKLIQGTYEQYVRETELAEARMRDHLDMIDSAKGTEMAELSIYESKRVMLRESIKSLAPLQIGRRLY